MSDTGKASSDEILGSGSKTLDDLDRVWENVRELEAFSAWKAAWQWKDHPQDAGNSEHIKAIKRGVKSWNKWRSRNSSKTWPHLRGADLRSAELPNAQLFAADLRGAMLWRTNLAGADLRHADLSGAMLWESNLEGADLDGADLEGAMLDGANLSTTSLSGSKLLNATLREADLRDAYLGIVEIEEPEDEIEEPDSVYVDLRKANLSGADMRDADISGAILEETLFANVNLRNIRGFKYVDYRGPSIIDGRTLARSQGRIPKEFLRGCGLSDWEIAATKLHEPDLATDRVIDITYEISRLKTEGPIQINPIFISYSHADASFIESLERLFDWKHVRYWRDAHDMKAGRMESQIERAIRLNPIVLLVLSEESVDSDWVEWEVSKARMLEKEQKRDVLCPVALDDAWKTCSWEGPLRRQVEKYHILDFSRWQDSETFSSQFQKLIEGLGLFYPKRAGSSHGQP